MSLLPSPLKSWANWRTTLIDADAKLPVPPSLEVTCDDVLVLRLALVPVTLTESVQEEFAASIPPERLILWLPATAVAVPPQALVRPLGVATTRPPGRM